jgi:hypothetical protein
MNVMENLLILSCQSNQLQRFEDIGTVEMQTLRAALISR